MFKLIFAGILSAVLSSGTVPQEDFLLGKWGCTDNSFVFMKKTGRTPDKKEVDAEVRAMGATKSNCVLTFTKGHKLNFRVGNKSFDLDWTLDPGTKEFATSIGLFTMKGYLVQKGNSILMIYSRRNLFMIMRFLCSSEGKKHISPLGELLDSCDGLTLGMTFNK